jgi:hypothetical protein
MSAAPQTTRQSVAQWLWALVGLSIIGFPAVIVFLLGVSFLLYVARLVLAAIFVLAAAGAFLLGIATRPRTPV